jgi:hypothetical protein
MTAVFKKKMIPISELGKSICAWDGCEATCAHDKNKYLPKGWTFMLVFWSAHPVLNFLDVPRNDMLRDAVLCPEHTNALDRQLKPLVSRRLDRETQGNA